MACCFACCVICGRQSLKLAIDVIDASADFLFLTKRIVIVPVFFFFVTLIFVFVWIGMLFCVVSMNDFVPSKTIPQYKTITEWKSEFNYWALWYLVFGLFWIVSFIQYKTRFIVQVSAASYYFNSEPTKEGEAEVSLGFKLAYFSHIGSLAFGSFIIGIIRLAKFIFVYAARSASKLSGGNKVTEMLIKCGLCYINCLEKITDYV